MISLFGLDTYNRIGSGLAVEFLYTLGLVGAKKVNLEPNRLPKLKKMLKAGKAAIKRALKVLKKPDGLDGEMEMETSTNKPLSSDAWRGHLSEHSPVQGGLKITIAVCAYQSSDLLHIQY